MNLDEKIRLAYDIKKNKFGDIIEFSYPNQTLAVSITNRNCSLGCAHCNGEYLKNMASLDEIERKIKKRNISSILLSGGCSSDRIVHGKNKRFEERRIQIKFSYRTYE